MNKAHLLAILALCAGCGHTERDSTQTLPEQVVCTHSHDLNGDGFADLIVPEEPEWEGGGAGPSWRASVYLGSSKNYRDPIEFRWSEGWGHNLVAYSLGDERGLGLTDVAFYPYQQGAAEAFCEDTTVLRSENGELVTRWMGAQCPEQGTDGHDTDYDGNIVFGDVDGDGRDEQLRWKHSGKETLLELVSADGETLASETEFADHERQYVAVGDVTGDGLPDALSMPSQYTAKVSLTLIAGSAAGIEAPTSRGTLTLASGRAGRAKVLGDLNGDGDVDFLLTSPKSPTYPEAEYALALSTGSQGYQLVSHADGALEPAGDIDCDGRDDVIGQRTSSSPGQGTLDVFRGSASGVSKVRSIAVPLAVNGTGVLPVFLPMHLRRATTP